MSAEIAEMNSRLAELMRVGTVHSIDYTDPPRVRISYGDGNISAPLPWMVGRAGSVQETNCPSVGEQVVIMNPSGTPGAGFVLPGALHKVGAEANADGFYKLTFPDSGKWQIVIGNLSISSENGKHLITVGSATYEISGGKHKFTGDMEVTGQITASVDVVGGGIHLKTHTHGGVQGGGGNTATPNP